MPAKDFSGFRHLQRFLDEWMPNVRPTVLGRSCFGWDGMVDRVVQLIFLLAEKGRILTVQNPLPVLEEKWSVLSMQHCWHC